MKPFAIAVDVLGRLALYDQWVVRDVSGKFFYSHVNQSDWTPFAWHPPSHERWMAQLPTQVSSCWNGLVAIDAAVFKPPHSLTFRSTAGTNNVSECQLFMADLWKRGLGRVAMAPRARVRLISG